MERQESQYGRGPEIISLAEVADRCQGIRKEEFSYRVEGLDEDDLYERYGVLALAVLKRICQLPQIAERGLAGFEASVRLSGRQSMRYCSIPVMEIGEPEFLSLSFDLEGCWMAVFPHEEFAEKTLDKLMDKLQLAKFRFRAPLGAAAKAAAKCLNESSNNLL